MQRAALNLSYQEKTPLRGQPECLLEMTGQDLIGEAHTRAGGPWGQH